MRQLAQVEQIDPAFPAFFRYRVVGERYLVTNQVGQFHLLEPAEFRAFVDGSLDPTSETYQALKEKNFLRAEVDVDDLAQRLAARQRFLHYGPNLHIAVVTLRCNETCVYCHASRAGMEATQTDMSKETAEKMVDLAFETTSPWVTLEFQGGEPLVNYPVMQHIIEYAKKKNETLGKSLEFTLVTNMSLMTEEKLDYLLDNKVQMCTSVDGPKHLHNKQRILPGGDAFSHATKWIKRINEAYAERGLDTTLYHVEALLTTTKEALKYPREIVDTYVELGCRALFLRPVDPFGFAAKTGQKVDYDRRAYLDFYAEAVDYMVQLNLQGTQILERYAAILLTKILGGEDPNFLDLRNPCGRRHRRARLQLRRAHLHQRRGPDAPRDGGRHVPHRPRGHLELPGAHGARDHPGGDPRLDPRLEPRLRELRLPPVLWDLPGVQLPAPGEPGRSDARQRLVPRDQGHPGLPLREARRGRPRDPGGLP